jgi:Tol biopolymer transport system component
VAGGAFSASDEGTIVYRPGMGSQIALMWIDQEGRRAGPIGSPAQYQQVVMSPSGRRAAMQRIDPDTGNPDIWLVELDNGIASRLTLDPALDGDPAWSPDERRLAFTSFRTGKGAAYVWDLVSGQERPLFSLPAPPRDPAPDAPTPPTSLAPARIPEGIAVDDWTADGRWLVVRTFGRAVYAVSMSGEPEPRLLADTPYVEDQTEVSPDGRWIAFNSDESGRWEVYVATFPAMTERRQVSNDGGMQPRWRRDGSALYYLSLDGTMMAADVASARPFALATPRRVFATRLSPSPNVPQYDVSPDGTRFLVLEPAHPSGEPVTFLLDWMQGLGR